MLLNKKAQSTLEYAVIIAVVVAALIAMQAYVKRGLQGKLRSASDDIGEQYSPSRTTSNQTINSHVESSENITLDGAGEAAQPTTVSDSDQTQNRSRNESVQGEAGEWWGGAAATNNTTTP